MAVSVNLDFMPSDQSRKAMLFDYFVLTVRVLLAWTFLRYGFSKISGDQFGLNAIELSEPVKNLGLFKLSWFLFDHQPFKFFIGISQIVCAVLLLINRTALFGAFLFLPIVSTILIIDLTFMPDPMKVSFGFRLSMYLLFDLILIWHYKDKVQAAFEMITTGIKSRFRYPIWAWVLLPLAAVFLELISVIPKDLYYLITDPEGFFKAISTVPDLFRELFN